MPDAARSVDARLARGRRGARRRAGRDARQRRQPVPPVADRLVRRASPPRWPSADPARRVIVTSGPSERDAADAVIARRARSGSAPAGAQRVAATAASSRWRSCARWWTAPRCTSAATADRCTSRRRRACRSWRSMGRRCRRARRPGGSGRRAESIESAAAACRPCDQRVCAPGDFRCLTRITPERVLEAAERALLGRNGSDDRGSLMHTSVTARLASPRAQPIARDRLELAGLAALFGVGARCSSRSPSPQILLAVALVCWVRRASSIAPRTRATCRAFFWPLLAYAGADARLGGVLAGSARRASSTRSSWCCS